MVFLDGQELARVWALVERTTGSAVDECPSSGECWQYMGSVVGEGLEAGRVRHEFRHRNLNRDHWNWPRRALLTIHECPGCLPMGNWSAECRTYCYSTGDAECATGGVE